MIRMKELKYKCICIPSGMHRSVEHGDTPYKLHPVVDASLTGCKRGETWHFLPRDANGTFNMVFYREMHLFRKRNRHIGLFKTLW